MRIGLLHITVFLVIGIVVLAGSGCGGANATSPHSPSTPRTAVPPTRPAQPTGPLSVYVGSTDGAVTALNATNGALQWRSQVASNASTMTVAGLADGTVYVSSTNVNKQPFTTGLAALHARDGASAWRLSVAGMAAIVATVPGVVYLALGGGDNTPHEIQMLRAQDGEVLWRTQVEGAGPLQASLHEGTIYVTSFTTQLPSPGYFYASTNVYALDASTGAISWHSTLARTDYLATVAEDALYLVDTGTDVVCEPLVLHVLSASDGAERWHSEGTLLRLIGVEQGRSYVAVVPQGCSALAYDHMALSALNTGDGSTVWQIDVTSAYGGLLANGVIYVTGSGSVLAAYRARDGSRLWQVQGESGRLWVFEQGPYVSIAGQGLDALDPATGAVRWRYRPGDDVSLATAASGVLYGTSSHQITGSSPNQAIVALTAGDGKLRWTFPIGAGAGIPIVG